MPLLDPVGTISNHLKTETMVVKAASAGLLAGDYAEITINGKKVNLYPNENRHFRGIHIVVIHPHTGAVAWSAAFDTYVQWKGLDYFCQHSSIPNDYIIVCACKDEASTNISQFSKQWFQKLGSENFCKLYFR